MKYLFLGLSLILFASCHKEMRINFRGTTPGVKSGTFIIKTLRDSSTLGVTITGEKFQCNGVLPREGYYIMDIVDDADVSSHDNHFEVYLEAGEYTVQTEAGKSSNYPKITSPSKIQADLSAYYKLVDEQGVSLRKEADEVKVKLRKMDRSSANQYNAMVEKLSAAEARETTGKFEALKLFVKQNPQSSISAYLMNKLDYESKPVEFYDVFKQFSPEAKASTDGKEIGVRLSNLVKLVPGAQSPDIVGNTPDGKPFDKSSIKKKLILLDFWRASDDISRLNHQQLISMLAHELKGKDGFGVVSIDFDAKADWWKTAIRDDKMPWTQVSDLKGDDSPNAPKWAISKIPTYDVVDSNWKIVERDIQLSEVSILVNRYLK
ncbi:MAG TPA: thioredoxin-like domain-containing protein [Mucilaginibacter sp.]|jgi:hypothetical protein